MLAACNICFLKTINSIGVQKYLFGINGLIEHSKYGIFSRYKNIKQRQMTISGTITHRLGQEQHRDEPLKAVHAAAADAEDNVPTGTGKSFYTLPPST